MGQGPDVRRGEAAARDLRLSRRVRRAGPKARVEIHAASRHGHNRRRTDRLRDRPGQHPVPRPRRPQPGLRRLQPHHHRVRRRRSGVPGGRRGRLRCAVRLADLHVRLGVHGRGQRLRPVLPAAAGDAARPRSPGRSRRPAGLLRLVVVRHAVRSRDRHRPDVLRGGRAGRPFRESAARGRLRGHCRRVQARHRLGHTITGACIRGRCSRSSRSPSPSPPTTSGCR